MLKINTLLLAGILMAVIGAGIISPISASAVPQRSKQFEAKDRVFQYEICPALLKIPGQKLSSKCLSYIKESDLDAAANAVCNKYGGNQLKSQCKDYDLASKDSSHSANQNGNTAPVGNMGAGGGGNPAATAANHCGEGDLAVETSIDVGCTGKGNPVLDMAFAGIRFLSYGVGLVIVGSLVMGGIQYSGSRGDPQATAMAVNRIRATLGALILYIFAYAILNYLVPGKILQ